MTEATTMTPEQAAEMKAQLDAYNAQVATAAAAAHAAQIAPLTALLASDTWAQFRAQIGPAARACMDEPYFQQVLALDTISANLAGQIVAANARP